MHELIGISYSAYSHKARWALEHADVPFTYVEYLPTLSEPALRLRLRKLQGPVSVPILFPERGAPLHGGLAIARFANAQNGRHALGEPETWARWDELANVALAEARLRATRRILQDERALEEQLTGLVPDAARGPLRPIASMAAKRLEKKYAHLAQTGAMRSALMKVRAQLAPSGGKFLLGSFSYADIAMVCALEMVKPIGRNHTANVPHTTVAWTWPELVEEFPDVLAWRTQLLGSGVTRFSFYRA